MGYTTEFKGSLKFSRELTGSELAKLKECLSQDRRDIGFPDGDKSIYEDGKYGSYWYHIDYELTEDFSGIQWNGTEKAYDMEYIAQWIQDKYLPENVVFMGDMVAQGEELEDRWVLKAENGEISKIEYPREGTKICCPHCEEEFYIGDKS